MKDEIIQMDLFEDDAVRKLDMSRRVDQRLW